MASQQDLQELLRLMTTGRGKLTMLAAMARVKALQTAGLRSIAEIAGADLQTVKEAIGDEKAAKQLHSAAKSAVKDPSKTKKRSASDAGVSDSKRRKSAYELDNEPETPEAREAVLALPEPSTDVDEISKTSIYTNRAPLLLCFALVLLKYTMPEQPLSSRLSLAEALVSVNSRSKAVSLGIEKSSAENDGWGQGQPKIKIMGREVYVLKRGDYNIPSQAENLEQNQSQEEEAQKDQPQHNEQGSEVSHHQSNPQILPPEKKWTISQSVTSKQSTFIARSIPISSSAEARQLRDQLLSTNPDLQSASHNIIAWITPQNLETSDDDGERGGGAHLLSILKEIKLSGIMLIVTRWYGGVFLGPDRWRIMREVSLDALSQRLRISSLSKDTPQALWGLDLETAKSSSSSVTGMPIHEPEKARSYIMKAFASAEDSKKKKTGPVIAAEKAKNLGLLIGALEMLFESWKEHISRAELDQRAWSWYARLRPEVGEGAAGWGAKGEVKLSNVLDLKRKG